MDERLNRARRDAGQSIVSASDGYLLTSTLRILLVSICVFLTVWLSSNAHQLQNGYLKRIGNSPIVDDVDDALTVSAVGRFLVRREHLNKRREAVEVRVMKAAMPGFYDDFYFGSINEMSRFTKFFFADSAQFDFAVNKLKHGLVLSNVFCASPADLDKCHIDIASQSLTSSESIKLVNFLRSEFSQPFFSELQSSGFSSVRPAMEQVIPLIANGDFEFFFDLEQSQELSKWIVIAGFFDAIGDLNAPSLERDLLLFYSSPVKREIGERIRNPALRVYRSAIESYYQGCFDEAFSYLEAFRGLTDSYLLQESATIFQARVIIRPLVRNFLISGSGDAYRMDDLGDQEYCGATYEQEFLIERAEQFLATNSRKFRRKQYQDDWSSLQELVKDYRIEYDIRIAQPVEEEEVADERAPPQADEQPRSDAPTKSISLSARGGGVSVAPARPPEDELKAVPKIELLRVQEGSPPSGERLVQLGAYASETMALVELSKLEEHFTEALSGRKYLIQEANAGGRTFFRLRLSGFDDLADARRFCAILVEGQASCIPITAQ